MPPLDPQAVAALKARLDEGQGPDLILDREIDRVMRGGRGPFMPWTSTIEAALTLFAPFGLEPADVLREVCKHHDMIKGEQFVNRLPRNIIAIGLSRLLEQPHP
jgi:hypothetical protein